VEYFKRLRLYMIGAVSYDTRIKAAAVLVISLCLLLLISNESLLAQQDQPKTEAQKLIDQAYSITGRGLDSITPEEASEAIRLYEEAYMLDPESFSVWEYTSLADVYNLLGNRAKASEILQQALDMNPYDFTTLFTIAISYLDYGMLDEAESLAYRAMALEYGQPSQAGGYGLLSRVYRQQGKDDLADWAEDLRAYIVEENNRRMDEYFKSLDKPESYEYPLAVAVYLAFVSLVAWADHFYRKKKGRRVSFRRDAVFLCVITAIISLPFVIIYPWRDLVSIPVAVLMFLIPQIGVLAIVTIMHYKIRVGFNPRELQA
jgi:tetratricopeptide (TPR) repeat protein